MRKSIIGGLGVGSGMAIFLAFSPPTGGVSAPSLLAWAPALAGITALIMLSAFVALRARGIANVIERGDAQVWEGERSFGCLSLWSRGARASGQLPGQGTRRRTGARFPRRWRPVSIGGPGTEAAGLQVARSWLPPRPTATAGIPSHPAGATRVASPARPSTRSSSEGSGDAGGGRSSYAELSAISGAAPGTTCGNHRAHSPRHLRAFPGIVFAVQMHVPTRKAERNPYCIPPYKRGVRRFKSYCAHWIYAGRRAVSELAQRAR